jgi:hypothetical protein
VTPRGVVLAHSRCAADRVRLLYASSAGFSGNQCVFRAG